VWVSVKFAPDRDWDIVPDSHIDLEQFKEVRRAGVERTRNAFWFAHEPSDARRGSIMAMFVSRPKQSGTSTSL
jgi:hypothetical protein